VKDPTTAQSGPEAALWLPTDDEWEFINLDAWFTQISSPTLASQWTLEEVFSISDDWKVTGRGLFKETPLNGIPARDHGFVLDVSSLVPEPTSATFALLAAPWLLIRRRSRRR
jgi:hypothetical protein